MSFLSRYRGGTLRAYSQDLRSFLRWCSERGVEPLLAERPHLELYLRWMEQQGLAPATIGRRFPRVAGFHRYAVSTGTARGPVAGGDARAGAVGGAALHRSAPLEYAALLTTARRDGPDSPALVALLDMIGLRVGEATGINVTDLRSQSGYELLTIMGKGAKPALIRCRCRSCARRRRCTGRHSSPAVGQAAG